MALTLFDGQNFSGRSEALKAFAWREGVKGQYLHPALEVNLSGFATTVGGELRLHPEQAALPAEVRHILDDGVSALPETQKLRSLSGGETVRLIATCALRSGAPRVAMDCALEQLDAETRGRLFNGVMKPLSASVDIAVADNASADLRGGFTEVRAFGSSQLDLNAHIGEFTENLRSGMVTAPAIDLKGLSFRYPGARRPIFDRCDFRLEPGRVYLLKAPNGAGKSTLARLLTGVLKPTRGRIIVDGAAHAPSSSNARLFFYAFQNPASQVIGTSAAGYLQLISRASCNRSTMLRGEWSFTPQTIQRAFGLDPFATTEPFDLPFVALKRLTMAAALLGGAPWLYFDEPALTADENSRQALRDLFSRLCRAGFGLVVVSHGEEFDGLTEAFPLTIAEGKLQRRVDG
ncbi:ATP-binding cassette domain-containing protein [Vitreimonas sp.]|uniref:ATP-binding cassette domain-containing protein n=1 Tax=Vitreimonas sp. TaxID=3069702 RepID=UPI002ED9C100